MKIEANIKDILEDENVRNKLSHVVVVESNKKEYSEWTQLDATLVLINQYFSLLQFPLPVNRHFC